MKWHPLELIYKITSLTSECASGHLWWIIYKKRPVPFKGEKEMATYSSILAWRIPWREEPGGLLSMGSHRFGHDWSDLACMYALEKERATHSSVLAWRVPGIEEPGGLPSLGSHRVGHHRSDLAAAAAALQWANSALEGASFGCAANRDLSLVLNPC